MVKCSDVQCGSVLQTVGMTVLGEKVADGTPVTVFSVGDDLYIRLHGVDLAIDRLRSGDEYLGLRGL